MEKAGEFTVEINMNVSNETIAVCVAVLNMHLKKGTSEAIVKSDENGICEYPYMTRKKIRQLQNG